MSRDHVDYTRKLVNIDYRANTLILNVNKLFLTLKFISSTCNVEYYSNPDKSDENDEMAIFSQTTNKPEDQKMGEKLALELIQKVSFVDIKTIRTPEYFPIIFLD